MKRGTAIRNEIRMKLNKKALTVVGVCLLLAGAVAANIILDQREKDPSALAASAGADGSMAVSATNSGFFEAFRSERESTRTQEIGYLDAVITQGADADTLADAQQQKLAIVDNMEKELTVESLIQAKGFPDVAVTLHKGSVNVILDAETLTDEQVAQVLDIIIRETGEAAENIKVSMAQ